MHCRPSQTYPEGQVIPQPPQLPSMERLTQCPLQQVSKMPSHFDPHSLQLLESLRVFTQ
jgi:hypothetical protein